MTESNDFGSILDNEPIARKKLTLFYLIDTSGSMRGDKIGTVNSVMEEVIPELRDLGGSDSEIMFQAMTFDDYVKWVYDKPVSIEDVSWVRLSTGGTTNLKAALVELNSKLSQKEFMSSPSLSFAPVIFLLSDGCPNYDYKEGLDKISGNKWFKYALKVAVAIGRDADDDTLAEFTGNVETVVHVNNGKALKNMIRAITVTSSQIGSKSSSIDPNGSALTPEEADKAKQDELIDAIAELNKKNKDDNIFTDDGW